MNDDYNAINLRRSHPTLYRLIMTCAIVGIALGINFWFAKPTFNPYGIDYRIIGAVFFALGSGKVVFLNVHRSVRVVRSIMAAEIGWMLFWGVGTTITFFQGKTSLQLFCLYVGLMFIELWLLLEPFANPLTGRYNPSAEVER